MFILDSLFMSGFRWVLTTVVNAAEAEMNDDTALREQLLAAEMRREMGEISDEEFAGIEADLLGRIREIKERREGGAGPIAFGGPLDASSDSRFNVEATVSGDFHEPAQPAAGLPPASAGGANPKERSGRSSRPARTPRRRRTAPAGRKIR